MVSRPDHESEEMSHDRRSGELGLDPPRVADRLADVGEGEENAERMSQAMHTFIARGDAPRLAQAVANFVRSATTRGEPIERVLAVLNEIAEEREGRSYPHDWQPSVLRQLVLRGVLLAFYGEDVVDEGARAQRQRQGEARERTDAAGTGDAERA